MVEQYLTHAKFILSDRYSVYKPNRTGIDSISRFGYQNEYDLADGLPLLTTKLIPWKLVVHELLWFLRGETNIKYLVDNGVHIWDGNAFQHYLNKRGPDAVRQLPMYSPDWVKAKDEYLQRIKEDPEFAQQHGSLGEVYGAQWRHWKTAEEKEIDQLAELIELLHKSPSSRRLIVTSWNPPEIPNMALPACHAFYQLNVTEVKADEKKDEQKRQDRADKPNGQKRLDLQLYQRSCDMFLGVPFNIASYALLTQILSQQANLTPGRFIHTFGDAHFYCGAGARGQFYVEKLEQLKRQVKNVVFLRSRIGYQQLAEWIERAAPPEEEGKRGQDHVTAILEQLSREPKPLPTMEIAQKSFDKLTIDDFVLQNYEPHPGIKRAMAV
ncbi:MAG: thymidylate synthase [Nanoarchaeota archaeon]